MTSFGERPEALRNLDLAAFVGTSVEAARQAVESAGGELRAVAPGEGLHLDYRFNRITMLVVDGRVTEVHGFG